MKVIIVFKRLLASGNDQHGCHLFKWGNRWNILGFNFTKRDALSSMYIRYLWPDQGKCDAFTPLHCFFKTGSL
jgi:hypothetical protein